MQNASGVTGAAPIWHDFMEGVLSSPDMLATLGAAGDWQLAVFAAGQGDAPA